jgi:hypothetical protein
MDAELMNRKSSFHALFFTMFVVGELLRMAKAFFSGIAYVLFSCNVDIMHWVGKRSVYLVFERWAEIVDTNSKDGM